MEKLEWERSYLASFIKPIAKEAAKETILFHWDPASPGEEITYFQLDDNHTVSLIGHVGDFEDLGRIVMMIMHRNPPRRTTTSRWRLTPSPREKAKSMNCIMSLMIVSLFVKGVSLQQTCNDYKNDMNYFLPSFSLITSGIKLLFSKSTCSYRFCSFFKEFSPILPIRSS